MSLLSVEDVTKSFGGVTAVDHVSFGIEKNEICALIGPNGAGKTTLFNVITGLYPPTSGRILFGKEVIDSLLPHQIAQKGIARTFQNLQVFENMTVLENVMVGRHSKTRTGLLAAALHLPSSIKEDREGIRFSIEMLERVGLGQRAKESAANLPFGQQRLLEIARAMAMEAQLLLLDEPAAGLNGRETRELEKVIGNLRDAGTAILLVEHDMETIMTLADKIVVLDFGEKIAEGTPEEIQQNKAVIKAYLGGGDGE